MISSKGIVSLLLLLPALAMAQKHPGSEAFIERASEEHGLDPAMVADVLEQAEFKPNIADAIARRQAGQPLRDKTYGSMFLNPPHASAAKLIDESQLKGYQIGDAKISCKHANFMVNTGRASFHDIQSLLQTVQNRVYTRTKIKLHPEVCQAP